MSDEVKKPDPSNIVKKPDPSNIVKKPDPSNIVKKPDTSEIKKPDTPEIKKPDTHEVDKNKGVADLISENLNALIRDFIPSPTAADIVSRNAKIVLYGLFVVVGLAILLFAFTVTNDKFDSSKVTPAVIKDGKIITPEQKVLLNASQQLIISQQLEQINSIYIAAISGALALGGTLIAQLWGRKN